MSEVRHKGKNPKQKEVIETTLEGDDSLGIIDILDKGVFGNKAGNLLADSAKDFNSLLYGEKEGKFKTGMKKNDVFNLFESDRSNIPELHKKLTNLAGSTEAGKTEKERLSKMPMDEFLSEMTQQSEKVSHSPKPATATPPETETETEIEKLRRENAFLKGQVSQYELYRIAQDEQERKILEMALQTGCYETIRNTDFSKVHFNAKELRPDKQLHKRFNKQNKCSSKS